VNLIRRVGRAVGRALARFPGDFHRGVIDGFEAIWYG
jgi:hypothetical protein